MFTGKKPPAGSHEWQIKEQIKQYLFHKGVDNNKTVVLIIDEGQKIPTFCLEILREFLNFETNEYKLLQIVIFAQKEFEGTVRKYPNFADRINLYHKIRPLNFRDTRLMIKYRLEKSSNSQRKMSLFTLPALWAIYRISGGYPRKIINLCHQSILSMIIQNRSKSGYFLVKTCARRVFPEDTRRRRLLRTALMTAGAAVVALLIFLPSGGFKSLQNQGIQSLKDIFYRQSRHEAGLAGAESKPRTFSARIAPSEFDTRQPRESEKTRIPDATVMVPTETADIEEDLPVVENSVKVRGSKTVEESVPGKSLAQPPEPPEEKPAAPLVAAVSVDKQPDVVSAENSNPEALDDNSADPEYSTILGQITLKRNETLSRIIKGVYGGFNSKYFKSFIIANPDIEDPDRVDVGQIVSLPAIPASVKPRNTPVWWVRIDDRDTLEAAFNILRDRPDNSPGVRLIPYWNPSDGTRFAVVLDTLFKDEPTARLHLRQLPVELVSHSTILSRWDKQTVYFADPYFN
jgi:general secretion pathway protein A